MPSPSKIIQSAKALKGLLDDVMSYPMAPEGTWYGEGTYKQQGGKIVNMSPDEYINSVRPLTLDETSLENINDLKNHILSGGQLDPLLIRANGMEDGRHRAYAAKALGIKQVPVIVYDKKYMTPKGLLD